MPNLDSVNYTLALLVIIGTVIGWWRGWWESPKRRQERAQNQAVAEAILGERAVKDRNDTVITPGRPGLVHRVHRVEQAVIELTNVATLNAKQQRQLDNHESRLTTHDHAIAALIAGSAERAATAMASAEMLRLVNERDTTDGDATET